MHYCATQISFVSYLFPLKILIKKSFPGVMETYCLSQRRPSQRVVDLRLLFSSLCSTLAESKIAWEQLRKQERKGGWLIQDLWSAGIDSFYMASALLLMVSNSCFVTLSKKMFFALTKKGSKIFESQLTSRGLILPQLKTGQNKKVWVR